MAGIYKKILPLAVLLASGGANAALIYDADATPDAIFGSGNTNGSYTIDRNNGIELALRGKLRHDASGAPQNIFNSNGDGTYSFAPGVGPSQSFPTAEWSFEWSINTDFEGQSGLVLSDLTYQLGLDMDPSMGTSFTMFDLINGAPCYDHSLGTNSTANESGIETNCGAATAASDYASNISTYNVAQNSWKPHWFISPFDPTVDGTYDFYLTAFDGNNNALASTNIQIIVGQGGTTNVPAPLPVFLMASGLLGMLFARKRK
ncbi:PEP-CTERM sorting domain-containing protein [Alteromonas halophila]|uniref:PEP-CTERM sorting domain-containing protein n=1 Tax=Alteromonas halophila TaxID=516698 RepID=A0A918JMJ0_9ALTE|nr:PEP-CTERM sorting domain-containing protein [Alteromonas halophila]GGW87250.1 hypothetical protein GCM10007391_21410 [Alteromonas halophila]